MAPTTILNCPACGGPRSTVAAQSDEQRRRRFLEFSRIKYRGVMDDWLDDLELVVLRCANCGHHWYREQPEQHRLSAMYESAVALIPRSENGTSITAHDPIVRHLLRLRPLCAGDGGGRPTLLDFGSGFGKWPRAAVMAGYAVCAFEPSRTRGGASERAFELVHDLRALDGRTFDAINVEQVLEHVGDPLTTLRQIRTFCAPHTVVRITVPNFLRPYEGRRLWADWPFDGRRTHTLAPFEHLHGFTPRSLDRVIARAGFVGAPAVRLTRHYPALQLRRAIGHLFPRVGTTFRIVRIQGTPAN